MVSQCLDQNLIWIQAVPRLEQLITNRDSSELRSVKDIHGDGFVLNGGGEW